MTDDKSTEAETAGDTLTDPDEHAAATDSLEPGEGVADPGVPNDVEVAARSADMEKPSTTHEKVFVLGPNPYATGKNPYTAGAGYDHEPNFAATRQYMIDSGLWPTSDVEHKSTKRHPDGESWILTYTVEAIPASDAAPGSQTPRVVGSDGADVPEDADEDSAAAIATGTTNYAPPPAADEEPVE